MSVPPLAQVASGRALDPRDIYIESSGVVHVLWCLKNSTTLENGAYYTYRSSAGQWQPGKLLEASGQGAQSGIVVPDGNGGLVAAWERVEGRRIRYSCRPLGSPDWTSPKDVCTYGGRLLRACWYGQRNALVFATKIDTGWFVVVAELKNYTWRTIIVGDTVPYAPPTRPYTDIWCSDKKTSVVLRRSDGIYISHYR